MKRNKIISVALLSIFGMLLGASCSSNVPSDSKIKEIYELAKDSGFKGTYEEWLESVRGEDGKDGHSPVVTIGSNGNWFIDGNDTGIKAKGEDGAPGKDGVDGEDGKDGEQGPQGPQGEPGKDGKSIISIELATSVENVDIYTITYSDGSSYIFKVTNGKDGATGEQGIQGEPGKDGHTPVVEVGENGNWFVDGVDTKIKAQGPQGPIGPQGPQGEPGKDGVSIISIEFTSSNDNVDTYTIKYSDGSTSTFKVTNGKDGATGEQGIQGIQGEPGKDGHTPKITIGENGNWFVDGVDTTIKAQGPQGPIGPQGPQGEQGEPGKDGVSIVSIEFTSSNDNVDTYTIKYSDGRTSTFKVTNGKDGATGEQGVQGIQGEPGKDGHTPKITIGENGNWFIDGVDTTIKAQGPQGPIGPQGPQGEPGKDGKDGSTWHTGNGEPGTFGNDGDFYLNKANYDLFTKVNGVWTKVGNIKGTSGQDGIDGKSAYEIYIESHPEYVGSETEWINDLINGKLGEQKTIRVTFMDQQAVYQVQEVPYGELVKKPQDPQKDGFIFNGWFAKGEKWDFSSDLPYKDLVLCSDYVEKPPFNAWDYISYQYKFYFSWHDEIDISNTDTYVYMYNDFEGTENAPYPGEKMAKFDTEVSDTGYFYTYYMESATKYRYATFVQIDRETGEIKEKTLDTKLKNQNNDGTGGMFDGLITLQSTFNSINNKHTFKEISLDYNLMHVTCDVDQRDHISVKYVSGRKFLEGETVKIKVESRTAKVKIDSVMNGDTIITPNEKDEYEIPNAKTASFTVHGHYDIQEMITDGEIGYVIENSIADNKDYRNPINKTIIKLEEIAKKLNVKLTRIYDRYDGSMDPGFENKYYETDIYIKQSSVNSLEYFLDIDLNGLGGQLTINENLRDITFASTKLLFNLLGNKSKDELIAENFGGYDKLNLSEFDKNYVYTSLVKRDNSVIDGFDSFKPSIEDINPTEAPYNLTPCFIVYNYDNGYRSPFINKATELYNYCNLNISIKQSLSQMKYTEYIKETILNENNEGFLIEVKDLKTIEEIEALNITKPIIYMTDRPILGDVLPTIKASNHYVVGARQSEFESAPAALIEEWFIKNFNI